MPEKRTYAVVGVGAVGGLYGARLQQAGHEVHYLLHSDYEHVRENGLEIKSPDGDIRLPEVKAYSDPAGMPPCDVIIVAIKATQNHLLKEILPALVRGRETVLLMQNGLGTEEKLHEMFPDCTVVGGLCFLCSSKTAPGFIHHQDFGHIHIAEYRPDNQPSGITPELEALVDDFTASGTDIKALDDLLYARWCKLVWNIPFNGMTVVFNTTTDVLMAGGATCSLAKDIMMEVVEGAAACGRKIEMSFVEQMLDYTQKMTPYKPSMMLDYEHSNPMELEAIYGNPIRAAADKGVDMYRTRVLYNTLKVLDSSGTRH